MTKTLAKVFGWVFILVGVLGFISNPIVGEMGYFHANVAHNLVHLVIGIILLMAAKTEEKAALWLKIVGIVYLLVAILGFMMTPAMGTTNLLGLVEVNNADNWLHVVLAVVVFFSGMAGGKKMMTGAQM